MADDTTAYWQTRMVPLAELTAAYGVTPEMIAQLTADVSPPEADRPENLPETDNRGTAT